MSVRREQADQWPGFFSHAASEARRADEVASTGLKLTAEETAAALNPAGSSEWLRASQVRVRFGPSRYRGKVLFDIGQTRGGLRFLRGILDKHDKAAARGGRKSEFGAAIRVFLADKRLAGIK